jgi:hypothetical protein
MRLVRQHFIGRVEGPERATLLGWKPPRMDGIRSQPMQGWIEEGGGHDGVRGPSWQVTAASLQWIAPWVVRTLE